MKLHETVCIMILTIFVGTGKEYAIGFDQIRTRYLNDFE